LWVFSVFPNDYPDSSQGFRYMSPRELGISTELVSAGSLFQALSQRRKWELRDFSVNDLQNGSGVCDM
jgi:hypothetical protein